MSISSSGETTDSRIGLGIVGSRLDSVQGLGGTSSEDTESSTMTPTQPMTKLPQDQPPPLLPRTTSYETSMAQLPSAPVSQPKPEPELEPDPEPEAESKPEPEPQLEVRAPRAPPTLSLAGLDLGTGFGQFDWDAPSSLDPETKRDQSSTIHTQSSSLPVVESATGTKAIDVSPASTSSASTSAIRVPTSPGSDTSDLSDEEADGVLAGLMDALVYDIDEDPTASEGGRFTGDAISSSSPLGLTQALPSDLTSRPASSRSTIRAYTPPTATARQMSSRRRSQTSIARWSVGSGAKRKKSQGFPPVSAPRTPHSPLTTLTTKTRHAVSPSVASVPVTEDGMSEADLAESDWDHPPPVPSIPDVRTLSTFFPVSPKPSPSSRSRRTSNASRRKKPVWGEPIRFDEQDNSIGGLPRVPSATTLTERQSFESNLVDGLSPIPPSPYARNRRSSKSSRSPKPRNRRPTGTTPGVDSNTLPEDIKHLGTSLPPLLAECI